MLFDLQRRQEFFLFRERNPLIIVTVLLESLSCSDWDAEKGKKKSNLSFSDSYRGGRRGGTPGAERDDAGDVYGRAAAGGPHSRTEQLVPGRGASLDGGGEQAVRVCARRARPLPPGLGEGGAGHPRPDGPRGRQPLQEPPARRPADRERPGALAGLRQRGQLVHSAVGRQWRLRARGLQARVPLRRRLREAAPWPHAGAGKEEGRAMDGGGAQVSILLHTTSGFCSVLRAIALRHARDWREFPSWIVEFHHHSLGFTSSE